MTRINLGCGYAVSEGWVNIDRESYGNPDVTVFDFAADEPLPFADDSVELVVAHHSLQMVDYLHIRTVIKDVYRILEPGGRFRVSVPGIEKAIVMLHNANLDWFPIVDQAETSVHGKFCAYLTWYSEARTLFTEGWLIELFDGAGFAYQGYPYRPGCPDCLPYEPMDGETDLDTRIEESLWIVGEK